MVIRWESLYRLTRSEFSENPDIFAEPALMYGLSDLRSSTQKRIFPSSASGALARHDGRQTSQHFVGPKETPIRKSTACDIFCEGSPIFTFTSILSLHTFKGIGIYLDTKGPDGLPWVMFHVDIRPNGFNDNSPLIWIVEKINGKDFYRYPQADHKYWDLFNDARFTSNKKFGS